MRTKIPWNEATPALYHGLHDDRGVFLVTNDAAGRSNLMTISWAQIGVLWGVPVLNVLVRESRYTHGCLTSSDAFAISVPPPGELTEALLLCGTRSGREMDKARACKLALCDGLDLAVRYVDECPIHFECRVILRHQFAVADLIADDLRVSNYPEGDPHMLVMGQVMGTYRSQPS